MSFESKLKYSVQTLEQSRPECKNRIISVTSEQNPALAVFVSDNDGRLNVEIPIYSEEGSPTVGEIRAFTFAAAQVGVREAERRRRQIERGVKIQRRQRAKIYPQSTLFK